ncbi:MAG: porin, partial [Planctomycetota bacterium]
EFSDDYDMGCTGCDSPSCTSCCESPGCGGGIAGGGRLLGSLASNLGWTHSAFGGLACGSGSCSAASCSSGCSGIFGGGRPCEDGCGDCDQCNSCCGFYTDLWVSTGFTSNANNPPSGLNFPLTFNDQDDEWVMNQLYLTLGRRVRSCGDSWDLGGRVDLLYGTDYFFTQAVGLETRQDGSPHWNSSNGPRSTGAAFYGLAMPQAYLEVYAPVLGGINFKIGHFYTTIGYESVMAPENFFYSHAYTMQYGEPFTHTGVLAEFSLTNKLSGHFGYTRGWDTWEDPNGTPGYLAGISWTPSDVASLAATVHTGREDAAGINDRTVYSIVYTRQLNPGLQYVLQHDFGMESNAEFDGAFRADSAKWYGLNQYLFMDITEKVTAGMRFEWFRDQDNARVLGIPFESTVSGGNYWGYTLGLNWRPTNNLTVRPEVRWDESDVVPPAGNGMFGDFGDQNQLTFAFDMILRF